MLEIPVITVHFPTNTNKRPAAVNNICIVGLTGLPMRPYECRWYLELSDYIQDTTWYSPRKTKGGDPAHIHECTGRAEPRLSITHAFVRSETISRDRHNVGRIRTPVVIATLKKMCGELNWYPLGDVRGTGSERQRPWTKARHVLEVG